MNIGGVVILGFGIIFILFMWWVAVYSKRRSNEGWKNK